MAEGAREGAHPLKKGKGVCVCVCVREGVYLQPIHPYVNVHDVNAHVNSLERSTHQFHRDVALRWSVFSFGTAIPPSLPSISLRALIQSTTKHSATLRFLTHFFLLP